MQNFIKTDKGIILLLILIFCSILPFFFLHQGLLLIDTGREFYIPQQMLQGKVLYKDIFNIYGPLSYQFNAILLSLFGQKINTLYFAGIINSLVIIITLYLLAREFLKKHVCFLFSILIMFSLVFTTFLYNSNLTYSFAIIYALSSFLISLLFLIRYIENGNTLMAYLSCLFAGISITNKYEFSLYPFVLAYVLIFIKPIGIKNIIKSLGCFILIPFISFGYILLQGININEIKDTIILFQNLVNAPTLKIFFLKVGVFFNFSYIKHLILQNKIFAIFGIIPLINLIIFLINIKKLYENKPLFILLLCAITASAKSFFYLNVNHMGIFIFPICSLALIILISKYYEKFIPIFLSACILLFAAEDFSALKYKNYFLKTKKGNIYTFKKDGEPIKKVSDFIINNTKNTDKTVVLPEGCFINFITERKGDDFYYNLSPLFYNDVFGEKRIIKHFKENLPEYFIILPINNIEYGSSYFGIDYAQNFYEMIINNYDIVKQENDIKIFKRKKI